MPKNPHADFSPVLDGYSGIGAFRFWCQTALPLTYDDSLSYYELLNKVVNYLNHTIEDLTAVESNTSALANAYDQLQKYVNDYFDDLDIEAELRNVLDAMAEDGTLDALLDPIVENQLPGVVEEKIDGVVAEQIDGAVAGQIDESVADQLPALVDAGVPGEVSDWLTENVNPVGSAVVVDSSLTISGAAADAKVTGDELSDLKTQINNYVRTGYYPLASDTAYKDYLKGILGLYIKNRVQNATYYFRVFRYKQTSGDWTGELTQVIIAYYVSGAKTDLTIVNRSTNPTDNIEVIDNAYCTMVIDWSKASSGQGYALGEDSRVLLDNTVFSPDANRFVKALAMLNASDSTKQPFVFPDADVIDVSDYLVHKVYGGSSWTDSNTALSVYQYPYDSSKKYCIIANPRHSRNFVSGNKIINVIASNSGGTKTYQKSIPFEVGSALVINDPLPSGTVYISIQILYCNSRSDVWLDDGEFYFFKSDDNIEIKSINGIPLAGNDATVATELAAHENAYNPHGITPTIIGLNDATVTASGLMSPQDKQKLDNILSPVTISITGSGVTKNASAFGFLPTNDAETNSDALQDALDGGGTIIVDYPGVYSVCKTALLDSDTTLIFGAGVYLSRAKDANNVTARYPFINRGAFTHTQNENISIIGLNLLTNGYGAGTDIPDTLIGQKGQLAFYGIKNLRIKDFTISDGTAEYYNIHIQDFENICLEGIHITSQKDGIHLGAGKKFVIRDAWFKTNDDGIALNGHDYPTGTMALGWIEDGLIENVHFLSAPDMNAGRGIYMLGGSWKTWESGMSVRDYGDAVVSNGRIYRTYGTISAEKLTTTSTVQPTHLSGVQTYSDGVTWLMAQNTDVGHTAGVKNVFMRNIFYERASSGAFTFHFDNDMYSRSYYPGSDMPYMENISVDGVYAEPSVIQHFINANAPYKNLKVNNVNATITGNHVFMGTVDATAQYPDSWALFDEVTFDHNETVVLVRDDLPLKIKICNSLPIGANLSFSKYGTNVTVLSNDIGLT